MTVKEKQHRHQAHMHAQKRISERIGVQYNRHIARDIIENIHNHKYGKGWVSIFRQWRQWYGAKDIGAWVLYDQKLNIIVTAIPIDIEPEGVIKRKKKGYCNESKKVG